MSVVPLTNFVYGAISACCWVVGLFFLSFWRRTQDRFFALFAVAFWMLALGRLGLAAAGSVHEEGSAIYLLRLCAYLLILAAIVDKNRGARAG